MHPSEIDQKGQEEKEGYDDDTSDSTIDNMLIHEIDSWNNLVCPGEGKQIVVNKILSECKENEDCNRVANSIYEYFAAESLFYSVDIAAAKDHKRIDCQDIRT